MKNIIYKYQSYLLMVIFSFCCLLLSLAQKSNGKKSKLNEFKWIVGTWKMPLKNGALFEKWKVVNDTIFQSAAYKVKNTGDTIRMESVKIEYKDKSYYYTSTVADQNNQQPVPFKITSHSKTTFTAENPQHDFPQRIVYELKGDGKLYAFIDGKLNGKYIKNEFTYSKIE